MNNRDMHSKVSVWKTDGTESHGGVAHLGRKSDTCDANCLETETCCRAWLESKTLRIIFEVPRDVIMWRLKSCRLLFMKFSPACSCCSSSSSSSSSSSLVVRPFFPLGTKGICETSPSVLPADLSTSLHASPYFPASIKTVLFQVCVGLPHLVACGFQSSAFFSAHSTALPKGWPTHFHFLILIRNIVGFSPVSFTTAHYYLLPEATFCPLFFTNIG